MKGAAMHWAIQTEGSLDLRVVRVRIYAHEWRDGQSVVAIWDRKEDKKTLSFDVFVPIAAWVCTDLGTG
jgi:hypothetical protein